MFKAEYVPWKQKGFPVPPPSAPPPRTRQRKPSTSLDTVTADYRIDDVRVLCWNKTPLDKLVNLAYDDIVRDEQAAASKGKEANPQAVKVELAPSVQTLENSPQKSSASS